MLNGLLAPLRIPERVIESLESLAEAARELAPMRAELVRVRKQTEPLAELMPAIERVLDYTEPVPELLAVVERITRQAEPLADLLSSLESVEKGLGERVDSLSEKVGVLNDHEAQLTHTVDELVGELKSMHQTIGGLKGDVERITDRLPDATRGPLEKARDAFTSSNE